MYSLDRSRLALRLSRELKKQFSTKNEVLELNRVLVLNKVSRLDVEKLLHPHLTEEDLKDNIVGRGIDYNCLLKHHQINKDFQNKVTSCIRGYGIDVREVNRFNCTDDDVDWCDAIIPIGGDGTFLNAARRIYCQTKPVIGFNSDPSRSEGFLCLPKKYSYNVASALNKLLEGKFKWLFRTRIRVTLSGNNESCSPTELHDVKVHATDNMNKENTINTKKKLPILALNEVFMSEIFAAKVSYFEMRVNNCKKSVRIKSSGLCICTGTGSTSWNLSINRISKQDVHDILMLYLSQTKGEVSKNFEDLVKNVLDNFNERFKFGAVGSIKQHNNVMCCGFAEDQILGYTIRDLISLGVWPQPKGLIEPRGFARTIELRSKCLDAAIIVDGGISFPFNEGAISYLQTYPEDALKTVILHD